MKQSILTRAAILAGLALGAFAISAFADWSNPKCTPTGCNTDAPINVGVNPQYKQGALGIGQTSGMPANFLFDVFGSANITDLWINSLHDSAGSAGSNGNCLTTDGTKVTWGSCGSGGSGGVTSVKSATPEVLTASPTTGDIVIAAHGAIGGGCWDSGTASNPSWQAFAWGNASLATVSNTNDPTWMGNYYSSSGGYQDCSCPSNFTAVKVRDDFASSGGYTNRAFFCVRN